MRKERSFARDRKLEYPTTVIPLESINVMFNWEAYRLILENEIKKKGNFTPEKFSYDVLVMFKIMILQERYGLADENVYSLINDCLNIPSFLKMGMNEKTPDKETILLFKEQLGENTIKKLLNAFSQLFQHQMLFEPQISHEHETLVEQKKNTIEKEKVLELLGKMPDNDDTDYTIKLRDFVVGNEMSENKKSLYYVLKGNFDLKIRFSAFYSLLIVYRKSADHSELIRLIDEYGAEYKGMKLYNIVMSLYYRNKFILTEGKEYAENAKEYADKACDSLPLNLAVKHHFATIITLMLEENITVKTEVVDKALDGLEKFISFNKGDAKPYCTKGRLMASRGNYKSAIRNIKIAMDLESIDDKYAMARIGRYTYHLLQIRMKESTAIIERKQEQLDAYIEKRSENGSIHILKSQIKV